MARLATAGELVPSCVSELRVESVTEFAVAGAQTRRLKLRATQTNDDVYAIEEIGVDVFVIARDANGKRLAVFDNPIARNGLHVTSSTIDGTRVATLEFESKEHKELRGRAVVSVLGLDSRVADRHCIEMLEALASADRDYGAAQYFRLRGGAESRFDSNARLSRSRDKYIVARKAVAAARVQDTAAIEAMLAALSYFNLDEWRASAAWADAASLNFDRVRADYAAARARSIKAAAWLEIATAAATATETVGAPQEALQKLATARTLLVTLEQYFLHKKEHYQAAIQTNNIGLSYFYQAEFERAIPYFERAEKQFAILREPLRKGVAIQNIALCEWGLGKLTAAISKFTESTTLVSIKANPGLHLQLLNNLGLASYAAGKFDDAQSAFSRAHAAADLVQLETYKARALYGLAVTMYALGDKLASQPLLEDALNVWTPALDARGRVAALRALAITKREQGLMVEALKLNREALALATAPSARGRIVIEMAENHLALGDVQSALGQLDPLAESRKAEDPLLAASAQLTRAVARRKLKSYDAALVDLNSALPVFRLLHDVSAEFRCLVEIAQVRLARQEFVDAARLLDEALTLSDEIRTQTTNPEYRASLAANLRAAQELRLTIYWREYLAASKRGDSVGSRNLALSSLTMVDSFRGLALEEIRSQSQDARLKSSDQFHATLQELAEVRYQLAVRYDRVGSTDAAARRLRARVAELRARLSANSRTISSVTGSTVSRQSHIRRRLTELGNRFKGHAFVEFWIGKDYAFAWVLRHDNLHWLRLADPRLLTKHAEQLAAAMANNSKQSQAERLTKSAAVNELVLRPLVKHIAGSLDVVIVPDGALAGLPFATLFDPSRERDRYFVQQVFLSMAPALGIVDSRKRSDRKNRFTKDLLVVADPVYESSDPRLRAIQLHDNVPGASAERTVIPAGRNYRRLVWSANEAQQIYGLVPTGRADKLLGPLADREHFISMPLRDYRFVHLAAHAFVDFDVPQLSAIVLSKIDSMGKATESELRAADIANLGVRAEAVVLSACSTAVGRSIAGEGVLGLQYAALAAGAEAVIATSWEVEDEITARLMTETYRRMLSDESNPSRAVGYAMRAILSSTPNADPALWGAFAAYVILPTAP